MWTIDDIAKANIKSATGITIGAFDGVHLGHQALIQRMVTESQAQGLIPLVVTFDPLPGEVLRPESYRRLSTLTERLQRMDRLGVRGVGVIPFTSAFMATSAQAFVDQLVGLLHMQGLWIGPDFTLGRDREGNVAYLQAAGRRQGFAVSVFHETIRWRGEPVRSSRIRRALRLGKIEEANGCLGCAYQLAGPIVRGDQRGRTLGFPTANMSISAKRLLPANGVYICRAHLPEGTFTAITNVGTRPTFDNGHRTVEAYLLDFSGDIYGEEMHLGFLHRLRPEWRFDSVNALIGQMVKDEHATRRWLARGSAAETCEAVAISPPVQD